MNSFPFAQERFKVLNKGARNCGQISAGEAVVLAKSDRSYRNVQLEDGFVPLPNDVNVGWAVVVRIDDDPERANPQNGWHGVSVA
jgi:hypothetical protein